MFNKKEAENVDGFVKTLVMFVREKQTCWTQENVLLSFRIIDTQLKEVNLLGIIDFYYVYVADYQQTNTMIVTQTFLMMCLSE